MLEPALYIRFRNEIQGNGYGINQNLRSAGADRTQKILRLGEQLFDRRLIRTARRQRLHPCANRLDRHSVGCLYTPPPFAVAGRGKGVYS